MDERGSCKAVGMGHFCRGNGCMVLIVSGMVGFRVLSMVVVEVVVALVV